MLQAKTNKRRRGMDMFLRYRGVIMRKDMKTCKVLQRRVCRVSDASVMDDEFSQQVRTVVAIGSAQIMIRCQHRGLVGNRDEWPRTIVIAVKKWKDDQQNGSVEGHAKREIMCLTW